MKSYIILIPVILFVILLSWDVGGVTTGTRLNSIAGAGLFFIIVLLSVNLYSSANLFWEDSLLPPVVLILCGIIVQMTAPLPALGCIPFREIIAFSLLVAAIILLHPPQRVIIFSFLTLAAWGVFLVLYGIFLREADSGAIGNIRATFINRNHFCAFIGMISPLCLSLGLVKSGRITRWISRLLFLILAAGVVLTGSRGGTLAFTISSIAVIAGYFILKRPGRRLGVSSILLMWLSFLIIIATVLIARDHLFPSYISTLTELSVRTRFSLWKSALRIFAERPWLGWGWGTFSHIYPVFKEAQVWYSVPHAHNELLQFLAEGGIVGFAGSVFFLCSSFFLLLTSFRKQPPGVTASLSLGVAGVLVYVIIHSFFDFILRLPANSFLLAVIVGLGISLSPTRPRLVSIFNRKVKLLFSISLIIILATVIFWPLSGYLRGDRYYRRGLLELSEGNPGSALSKFSAAIDSDSTRSEFYLGRARARIRLFEKFGDKIRAFGDIEADFDRAEKENPWDATIPWTRGLFYRGLRAYEKEKEALEEALLLDPTNPFILIDLARSDLDQGRLDRAADRLHKAAGYYPSVGPICLNLMISATDDYSILRKVPPALDWLHRSLGGYLLTLGMREEAEEELREAIALNPDRTANWLALGEAYLQGGRYDEAGAAFKRAIVLNPDDGYGWSRLGEVYLKLDKNETALFLLRKAWSHQIDGRKYSKRVYSVIKEVEGNAAAREFLSEVSGKSLEWAWPYSVLALISLEEDNCPQARNEINEALEREPTHPYYLKLKSRIDRKLSNN